MKIAFADTSYYIAILNRADRHHSKARQVTAVHRGGKVVTSEWVLCEVANSLSLQPTRPQVVQLVQRLRAAKDSKVVASDPLLFEAGFDLYQRRLDKAWSLTDCISLVIMRNEGIQDAWTADHHFTQAGFNALLV